jgi:hypothetical protein
VQWSWGRSVSIMSVCWLDDRGLIPSRGKVFFFGLCVETSSEAHPASYSMGGGGGIPGIKSGRGVTLTSHPYLEWVRTIRPFTRGACIHARDSFALLTRVIQKVRFPIFCLNKITTYRVTHEAEIQSHISFTSPHDHQVCLDTYSDISICQVLHKKNCVLCTLTSFWTSSLEWKRWLLGCFFIFGNRWKFDGAKSGLHGGCGKISQPQEFKRFTVATALWGQALSWKEELRVHWSTILGSCAE